MICACEKTVIMQLNKKHQNETSTFP